MMERPPSSAAAESTASRNASGSPTSTPAATPPISSATALADSQLRSNTATRAPSSAMRRHVARPMPDPPPVTTALCPSSSPIVPSCRCRCRCVTVGPQGRRHLQRLVELPDQQFLRHAQVQGAVLAGHGRNDGGPPTGVHERMEVEEAPCVGPPWAVEPQGMIEAGVGVSAPDAQAEGTEGRPRHVREVGEDARMDRRVVGQRLPCAEPAAASRQVRPVFPTLGPPELAYVERKGRLEPLDLGGWRYIRSDGELVVVAVFRKVERA